MRAPMSKWGKQVGIATVGIRS